ncbi:Cytochrome c, mono-and diheme variants [Polaromonas sp. OV174]|uniref:c-type cytochrome n=1 Tax=Polaromonas sp. OV174 TaxID=1855300 RepID=UPI0008ECB2EC|nr:cytochrome c [Polaromonas sp. OV174]SFC28240.1 Cytochrome c, mono-and diheme variants [Polaromonas sp. OV174]
MTFQSLSRHLSALSLGMLGLLSASAMAAAPPELVQRGKYLATAGDCVACHTAPGGKPMAGGLALPTPIGDIIGTNITPSKTHGIGNYTEAQFRDALRKGVRADGQHLYPAMPYTSYALVSDDDANAMYAYFMQEVAPVDAAPAKATALPFPFNIRLSMAAWNLLFLDNKPFAADASKSAEWNRGAYLTRGLTHCSTCHSPRNVMMAEDIKRELGGGAVGTWFAPNITSDANSGIGAWTEQEIADYMRLGHVANKGQAAGPMAEAVDNSLQHLTPQDLLAIAVYVKSVPAIHDAADTKPAHEWGAPRNDLGSVRGVAWPKDRDQLSGAQLYDAHCATCHQASGQGSFDGGLPPLFHNTAVGRSNTNNLVMVLLDGIERHGEGAHSGPEVKMQGFRKVMSDVQMATLATYLTKQYGNPDIKVSAEQVRSLRAGGEPSRLALLAQGGIAFGVLIVIALIMWLLRRGKKRA